MATWIERGLNISTSSSDLLYAEEAADDARDFASALVLDPKFGNVLRLYKGGFPNKKVKAVDYIRYYLQQVDARFRQTVSSSDRKKYRDEILSSPESVTRFIQAVIQSAGKIKTVDNLIRR